MSEYRLLPIALGELEDALDWYANRSPFAATRLAAEVTATLAAIEANPERFARWDERHRYVKLKKFPYFIAFRVVSGNPLVVAIRHAAQDDIDFNQR